MKIVEFTHADNKELPFDVVEDAIVFMRNDPMFYRKQLFPAILRIKGMYDNEIKINPNEVFGSIIDKALGSYCRKFNIMKRPDELLGDDERTALVHKLHSEEMTNIRNGAY
jgi:hypothetical protein